LFVSLARVTLHFDHCRSLKDRRSVVRRIQDRVMNRSKIWVADVGGQDTWQRIELGFAVVSHNGAKARQVADEVLRFIDDIGDGRRVDLQRHDMAFGEERPAADDLESWVPPFAQEEEA